MNSIITYGFFGPVNNCFNIIGKVGYPSTPLQQWLMFGKIAENPTVEPSNTASITVYPSAQNRYLESVTVEEFSFNN